MLGIDFRLTAIEIVHHAGPHVRRADGQAWHSCLDDGKIHKLSQGLPERCGRIESGTIHPQWNVRSPECRQMRLKKPGDASQKGRPVRPRVRHSRPSRCERPSTRALHPVPELVELGEPVLWLIARDDAGVDGTNRRADDPIRLDPRLMKRLIYANLVST